MYPGLRRSASTAAGGYRCGDAATLERRQTAAKLRQRAGLPALAFDSVGGGVPSLEDLYPGLKARLERA